MGQTLGIKDTFEKVLRAGRRLLTLRDLNRRKERENFQVGKTA